MAGGVSVMVSWRFVLFGERCKLDSKEIHSCRDVMDLQRKSHGMLCICKERKSLLIFVGFFGVLFVEALISIW